MAQLNKTHNLDHLQHVNDDIVRSAKFLTPGMFQAFATAQIPKKVKTVPAELTPIEVHQLNERHTEALSWEMFNNYEGRHVWLPKLKRAKPHQYAALLKKWGDAGRGGVQSGPESPF